MMKPQYSLDYLYKWLQTIYLYKCFSNCQTFPLPHHDLEAKQNK